MEMKTQLQICLKNTDDQSEKDLIENQLKVVDNYLSSKCAKSNRDEIC